MISDSQSAFIKGRLVSDNILVAYEVMHFLRRKRQGNNGFMFIKLDMSKTYDRVELNYLKKVMMFMGFKHSFIDFIMSCVSLASFLVLVNGSPKGHIVLTRGLGQGILYRLISSSCVLNV